MKTPPTPPDRPTRRTVETLFRELSRLAYGRTRAERDAMDRLDAVEAELKQTPKYKAAAKAYERARVAERGARAKLSERMAKVRRLYLTHGLTPAVRRQIGELATLANSLGLGE